MKHSKSEGPPLSCRPNILYFVAGQMRADAQHYLGNPAARKGEGPLRLPFPTVLIAPACQAFLSVHGRRAHWIGMM